jgi:alkanesulfonate monooxygenase SsuD/methylene tetrahydromethanopterin reductase-like flavin-dependent oxidoreductase (luciferase family)
VLVGGGGERKTLRLVARYADACNLFASSPTEIAHKLEVLRRHCDAEMRDYDTVTKTVLVVGEPFDDQKAFLSDMAEYARLGVDTAILVPRGDPVAYT